jgi:hypothetical protein
MNHPVIPVVIIGAGPTGLTAATLLAQYDIPCLVLDRWDAVYPQPRAVHLDDEVYRILSRLGIRDEFAVISRPCRGLRLVEPDMTVLAELQRDTDQGRHGYPQANMFDQPELEALLRANLPRHPSATLRGGTEVTALSQDGDGPVRVDVTDHVHGTSDTLLAAYVLGCDGANSIARTAIDAHMTDLKFDQRWLVVDVDTPRDLAEWEGVHQVCDTRRAGTYMRIGDTRYRWEFRLAAGETADDYRDITHLHPLIAGWTKSTPLDQLHIEPRAEHMLGDLTDVAFCHEATRDMEIVFHVAGIKGSVEVTTRQPASFFVPLLLMNTNVLEAARVSGVKRLVYAGSSSVYGDTPTLPKREDMVPGQLSPYALQKLMSEQYCRMFTQLYGLETVSIRYFNVFGPRQDPGSPYSGVISLFSTEPQVKSILT